MDTQAPAITPKAEPPPPAQPPQAPQGSVDPWGTPPPAPHDPSAAQIDPPAPPAAADPDDQVLDVNPFATAQGPSGRRRGLLNGNGMMARAMAAHLCRKLVQCGSDEPLLTSACDGFSHLPDPTLPSCPAALRCLRDIDTMDCASPSSAIQATRQLMQFSDCIDASRC
jgi:hypothetical protein